jgi:hypothetical protein
MAGRLVITARTPARTSPAMRSGSSTVHTTTPSPASRSSARRAAVAMEWWGHTPRTPSARTPARTSSSQRSVRKYRSASGASRPSSWTISGWNEEKTVRPIIPVSRTARMEGASAPCDFTSTFRKAPASAAQAVASPISGRGSPPARASAMRAQGRAASAPERSVVRSSVGS